MLTFPDINPVAFSLGPLKVHWYGLMYLAGFAAAWWLARVRAREPWRQFSTNDVDDVLFYAALGVVVGGRLGYVLFYDFDAVIENPLRVFQVWNGGMSFHGGLLGVIVAMAWFARRQGRAFFAVADFIAPLVPPGLFAGRIGNFINGNLWGRPSELPWAMVFPRADTQPRHPSQLYEAALEGIVLFALLWWFSRKPRPVAAVCGVFLVGYGLARFAVEFVRVPDAHLGYLAFGWFTMGQALTLPMILFGVGLLLFAARRARLPQSEPPAQMAAMPSRASRGGRSNKGRRR